MKNTFTRIGLSAMVFLIIAGCAGDNRQKEEYAVAEEVVPSLPYLAEFNDMGEITVSKNDAFDFSIIQQDRLVGAFEHHYPEIDLEISHIAADTIYIRIADATFLTQRMGSAGAWSYLMEVTYALTELPEIEAVSFDFEEGDHAVPDIYTRASFGQQIIAR